MKDINTIQKAELAKARGLALTSAKNPGHINATRLAFLETILSSPDGTATIDDATIDLDIKMPAGGNWRGAVVNSLAMQNIIVAIDYVKSKRSTRHRGRIALWKLIDRPKAMAMCEEMRRIVNTPIKKPVAATTGPSSKGILLDELS